MGKVSLLIHELLLLSHDHTFTLVLIGRRNYLRICVLLIDLHRLILIVVSRLARESVVLFKLPRIRQNLLNVAVVRHAVVPCHLTEPNPAKTVFTSDAAASI